MIWISLVMMTINLIIGGYSIVEGSRAIAILNVLAALLSATTLISQHA
jgi:hypothetical protein